jgi:amidase
VIGYTTWVNLLDYTAAVLPVTTCDKNVDLFDEGYVAKSEQDDMIHKTCMSNSFSLSLTS